MARRLQPSIDETDRRPERYVDPSHTMRAASLRNKLSVVFCLATLFHLWPSVLWRSWLGCRKSIRPVKNWVVGCCCQISFNSAVIIIIIPKWNKVHTHPFNSPLSRSTKVSRYQKGKANLDFIEARDSERQWHQLGHMQVCKCAPRSRQITTPAPNQTCMWPSWDYNDDDHRFACPACPGFMR